ncbi:hypothetical protein ZIOFF_074257 [Zingiber officinale]|uniref:AP2/ERF domain-containing protein n=1 Tax=Zingiber officinale TaxID=94328 RepID=A0A8J5CAG6_ZINOF|nr:hypothetical protein ZIOFF_074257 [Zingiber officinale]
MDMTFISCAYDEEEAAARAYDLAALKYWGAGTLINFPVTDYARDLEEMQTISKEDYLVSLRRHVDYMTFWVFSWMFLHLILVLLEIVYPTIILLEVIVFILRQPNNSRWEASFGPMQGNDYFSNCSNFNLITPMQGTSSDATTDARYSGIAGTERKIDLTSYIRWWMPKKVHQTESASTEDVARELKMLECSAQPTEPYKLPSLGYPLKGKPSPQSLSACSILSQSDSFMSFVEKSLNSEENKNDPSQLKIHQESVPLFSNCGLGISGVSLAFNDLPVPRTAYQMALLSAPLRTNYSGDTVTEPLWTSLVPPSEQSTETTVLPSS